MKCKWTERKCWDFLLCEWWVVNFFLSCWLIIREEFNDCQQKIFFMFLLVVVCGEIIFFDMETSTRSNHRFFVLLMPTVKLWKKHWKIEAQSPQQQRLQLRHKQQQVEDIFFSCWLSQTDLQFFFLQFSIAHLNHNCSHDLLSFFLLIFYVFSHFVSCPIFFFKSKWENLKFVQTREEEKKEFVMNMTRKLVDVIIISNQNAKENLFTLWLMKVIKSVRLIVGYNGTRVISLTCLQVRNGNKNYGHLGVWWSVVIWCEGKTTRNLIALENILIWLAHDGWSYPRLQFCCAHETLWK